MKVILANLGFVLQMTGMFMLIPIAASLGLRTQDASISLLITALSFFVLGFFMNAMCERKELTFKQSNGLIALAFLGLSVIGAFPYFLTVFADQTLWLRITNSLFESISGFTTTGFSAITDVSSLPVAMHLYRSLTQFVGGLGIVLMLLMLFYPEEKLQSLAKSLGLDNNERIKKTFAIVVLVYIIVGALTIIGAVFTTNLNSLDVVSYILASLGSGGFAPVTDPSFTLTSALGIWVIIAMFLGATNFFVITNTVKFQFRRVIHSELPLFLGIIAIATVLLHLGGGLSWYHALFQVISASSTTGFATLSLQTVSPLVHWTLVVLMFIGGMTISTAGGIRILRLIVAIKSIPFTVNRLLKDNTTPFCLFGREYKLIEVMYMLLTIILAGVLIFASALVMRSTGVSLDDAVFEVVSAITCTGLSVGVISATSSIAMKWFFMLLMLIGRIEIFTLLFALGKEDSKRHDVAQNVFATHTQPIVYEKSR